MLAPRVIEAAEPVLVIAITPLLLFPGLRPGWTAAALALMVAVWLVRAATTWETWPVTPLNLALLLFCLTIPVGVWASATPELTLPKLTSLILGLAIVRALALWVRTPTRLVIGLGVFGLLGLGIWAFGLLGGGFSFLHPLVQRLPHALLTVVEGPDGSVNPNVLAGSLGVYLPIAVALAAYCWCAGSKLLAAVLVLAGLLIAATLFLARSRSAMVGAAAAVVMLAFLFAWFRTGQRSRRSLVIGFVALVLVAVVGGAALLTGRAGDAASASQVTAGDAQLTIAARVEIWSRALYALQDFPFTGVGLGTFGRALHVLYPLFLTPAGADIQHAHNIFLQVGVDHGLGGLIAYVAILLASVVTAWQAASRWSGLPHYVALGLLSSLFGLHVYGFTDALESKPGIVLWVLLGLIAALANDLGLARGAAKIRQERVPLRVQVGAQGTQALAVRDGYFGHVEEPVGDDGRPDAAGHQK